MQTGQRQRRAERFYRSLPRPSLVGLESCGNSQCLWVVGKLGTRFDRRCSADSASYVRKQKTDKRDAYTF